MVQKFWRLHYPDDDRKAATWDERVKHYGDPIVCPENPGHQRAGKRNKDLHVVLPRPPLDDFVWTWQGECMIQDHVLELFRAQGFTGFEVKPVTARYKRSEIRPPSLWELIVTGWAGVAPPDSGIREIAMCPACRLRRYTKLDHPEKLIDERQWDGSDFFIVWPLAAVTFISGRVAQVLQDHGLKGFVLQDPISLRLGYLTDELSATRLSNRMPDARARELGEPLGIY